uniref:Protein cactus (TOLL pathway signalling) n=1 Tax=Anopheles atroparvus TaxID=41427 RepID=A0AAG5CVZ5_ANOAO
MQHPRSHDTSGQLVSEKKDCCDSANTDSGFLSGHNLNTSGIISSSETFPEPDLPRSGTGATAPAPIVKQSCATHPDTDSGMIPDAEIDSSNYGIIDICERFDRLMKRDWMKCYQQDELGETSLHLAVYEGNHEFISRLTANVPRQFLNIQNDCAQTALHLAVLMDQPRIVRQLLQAGTNQTIRDANGNTALHLACGHGKVASAKELLTPLNSAELQQGIANVSQDLELWNYDGKTCVHLAAEAGSIDILRYLIDAGADINSKEGKSGLSALHISIERGNEVLANFLLDECPRISLEAVTYAGLTAYQLALIQDKRILVNDLTKRGAEQISAPESDIDSDSDDELINNYYGTNAFSATFQGLSVIDVS